MSASLKNFSIQTGEVTTDVAGEATITLTCFGPDDSPCIVPTPIGTGGNANISVSDIQYNGTSWTAKIKSSAPLITVQYQAFTSSGEDANSAGSDDFVILIETTADGQSFTFPAGGADTQYDINWGDRSSETVVSSGASASSTHTYEKAGEYYIRVRNWSGTVIAIDFSFISSRSRLKEVIQWGSAKWTSFEQTFNDCTNLTTFGNDKPDLSNCTSMNLMLIDCSSFNGPLNQWDVSNIESMNSVFLYASSFNQPLDNWNVSSVTSMISMFRSASAFNQPIGSWNVSSVTDMRNMFQSAASFNQPIGSWDVSNVTDMSAMFQVASSFDQPLNSWDVSNVDSFRLMFRFASAFNQPLNNWNVRNASNLSFMFAASAFNPNSFDQDIGSWKLNPVGPPNLASMLDYSGMGVTNYNSLLVGWYTYVSGDDGGTKGVNEPSQVQLGAQNMQYTIGSGANLARSLFVQPLPTYPEWTISGDSGV